MFNTTEEESREWLSTKFGMIIIKIYDDEVLLTRHDLESMLEALEESEGEES